METLHTVWVHFGVQRWADAIFKTWGKGKCLGSQPTLLPSVSLSRCLLLDGQMFVTWLCPLFVYQLPLWHFRGRYMGYNTTQQTTYKICI